ncbi:MULTISPECIES: GAF domain-containing sensor histidine kinase [Synechocystis]|uniref:histidine kinase n=1 Tax=Synechocystis salina LEGE 00031 TaxID=1828736 RepID=A0ABR9VSP4_9SYNC|nr:MULTISPECIES: ATP-binding protein [Synechocystis]MBD2654302.1 GAF domain-containing protein [Synechocystis sp. FACHB-383]MBE9196912.1 GAF domain-containing protein [Synechocystis sp. LEGE 06083]MBE9240934.1 GAF domain-containing protein [Synechocystis salina LEGE 00041]MBE9254382.1 GAF domain-containing protein [Synechocystis salina LEGE 00031]
MGQPSDLTESTLRFSSLDPLHPPVISQLTAIAKRIRRNSLHLPTIWQEAVDSIGSTLGVSRCLLLTRDTQSRHLQIEAEFCQPTVAAFTNLIVPEESEIWRRLFEQHQPLTLYDIQFQGEDLAGLWIFPTLYQDQANGYLCLQQLSPAPGPWHPETEALLQELAEQTGTAIAHATLYQELRQATKAAEEASRLKSEFLASTTHELRTPLNGIIGFLRLILDDMADSEAERHEFIEEAYQSALLLLNLINDILDLAKIEAGRVGIELEVVDFGEVLQATENFALPQAQNKGLSFCLTAPPQRPLAVYGNQRWLLQVMLNIVGNALKFTHEGGITVTVEVVPRTVVWEGVQKPGLLKVSVADTGIGVSLEQQSKLFKKFVQIDGSHSKAYGGTGLGLVISQKLVETMGGKVAFFSMGEGLGSTVTFTVLLEELP